MTTKKLIIISILISLFWLMGENHLGENHPVPDGVDIPMGSGSSINFNGLGQVYGGASVYFPSPTQTGSLNRASITSHIPYGYEQLEFRNLGLNVTPGESAGVFHEVSGLFLILLGSGPDEPDWGPVVFANGIRVLSEPANVMVEGFTVDLNGASYITVLFHQVNFGYTPDHSPSMNIQFTGQLK